MLLPLKLKRANRAINLNLKGFMKILLLSIFSLAFSQYNYSLQDENSSSDYYQQFVGPSYFDNQITMHYFGSFT